eukprot:9473228-Pyramimonas_sp.AAC.1
MPLGSVVLNPEARRQAAGQWPRRGPGPCEARAASKPQRLEPKMGYVPHRSPHHTHSTPPEGGRSG